MLAVMHHHAACNAVTPRTVKVVFSTIVDVGYFSHTPGEKVWTPHLFFFMVWWISLFSHGLKSVLLWNTRTGQAFSGILCDKMVEYV